MPPQSKRLTILSPSEVKELYSVPKLSPSQKEFFFQLNSIEHKSFKNLKSLHAKVFFVLLLGHFKNKPITLDFNATDIKDDIEHILKRYCAGKSLKDRKLDPSQKTRLYQRIYKLTGSEGFSAKQQKSLAKRAGEMARICVNPRYLFDECVANLTGAKVALPKYTTLQDVVSQALSTERKRIQAILAKRLDSDLETQIQHIIETKEPFSLLTTLKRLPKDFTHKELGKEIKSFDLLKELYPKVVSLLDALSLSNENIDHYASLVDFYTITKLRRFEKSTTVLYILCFIHRRFRQINDNLVNAFIYNVRKLKEEATTYAKAQAYESVKSVGSKVKKASALLSLFIDDGIDDETPFKDVRSKAFEVIPKNDIELVSNYLADIKVDIQSLEWQFYEDNSARIQKNLRRLFCCISFEGRLDEERITTQITNAQDDLGTNNAICKIDRRLITKRLRPYLYDDYDSAKPTNVNVDRYEVMLYQLIRDSIDSGHIFVPNSQEYRSLDDDLVNEQEWKHKNKLMAESKLEIFKGPAEKHIDHLIDRLETKLSEVSERINNGDNQVVILTDRSGQTKWKLPSSSVGPSVNNPFFEKLRQVHIGELLTHVSDDVGFLDTFTHVQPRYQKTEADLHNIIACLVANGTNFGLTKMAHISDRSIDHLRTTQANFLRPETLHQANDQISNKIASLPIFKHYNIQEGSVHASIDGQKFECRLNSFKTRYSSKYFGLNKGVSSLTLVANHVPINAKVIGANEYEGHHAFDLLYNNSSEIQPNVLSSDNHVLYI